MKSIKKYIIFTLLLFMFCSTVPIVTYATDTSTHQEGEVYQGEDGFYYKIIDGKPYKVEGGSGSQGSISDEFKNYSSTTTPDGETMQKVNTKVSSVTGTAISVIMYLIFAFTGFTTACDLLYISMPPLRSVLCPANGGYANGYSSYTRESADKASQRGDMAKAAMLHRQADDIEMHGNGIAHVNGKNGSAAPRSWISSELRSLVSNVQTNGQISQDRNFTATTGINLMQSKKNLLVEYFKRRAVGIIYMVVVLILLVTTSIFTDLGFNIGELIFEKVSSFLGF